MRLLCWLKWRVRKDIGEFLYKSVGNRAGGLLTGPNKVGPPRVMTGLARGPALIAFYLFLIFPESATSLRRDPVA